MAKEPKGRVVKDAGTTKVLDMWKILSYIYQIEELLKALKKQQKGKRRRNIKRKEVLNGEEITNNWWNSSFL